MSADDPELRDFFDGAVDLLCVATADGVFLRLNRAWQTVLGYPPAELLGRRYLELVHPEDRESSIAHAQRMLHDCTANEFVNRYRHRDGTWRTLAWSLTLDASRTRCFASARDLTRSQTIARARQLTDERLQNHQILDAIQDMVLVKGPGSRIVWANGAFQRCYGMTIEQLRDLIDAPETPPDYTQQYVKDDLQVFSSGKALDIPEEPVRIHDGGVRYFHTVKTPIFGSDGKVVMTVGVSRDITERRAADERLSRAMGESETLLSTLSAVLVGIDAAGRISRWNQAAEEVLGLPASDMLGRSWLQADLPVDGTALESAIARVRAVGSDVDIDELPFRRRDGTTGVLAVSVCAAGAAGAVTVLATDISERKRLEAQRAQSQKLETVGGLAAGVAHEINTPIQFISDNLAFLADALGGHARWRSAIAGALDTLRRGEPVARALQLADAATAEADLAYLDEQLPRAISDSLDGAKQIAQIVRALKDFSHPDAVAKTPVDLNRLLTTTLTVARNEYKYVAEVVTDLDPQLPEVPGNPGELCQAFLNLLVNAAHAIAEGIPPSAGKGRITVSTRRDGGSVRVVIADNGAGIPEAILGKIFDPFFTTKPVGRGTGQGLFIVHGIIVGRHGGSIGVDSTVGRGTTFTIQVPLGDG